MNSNKTKLTITKCVEIAEKVNVRRIMGFRFSFSFYKKRKEKKKTLL